MSFLAQKRVDQGDLVEVVLTLAELKDSQLGSPDFVISVIIYCKDLLKGSNSHAYVIIEAFMPTAYEYKGDIQMETIQQALGHITSLEQDANLPENVQKILDELKHFYYGGAIPDDVAKVWCCRPAATAWASQPSLGCLESFHMQNISLWKAFK